ncbi:MAG: hypothetical protein ACI9N1_002523 [Flavobacteriales bacterium]|jgi:hypothetical protein
MKYFSFLITTVLLISCGEEKSKADNPPFRENAQTPMDENNPETLLELEAYLNRDKYGNQPTLVDSSFVDKEIRQLSYVDSIWMLVDTINLKCEDTRKVTTPTISQSIIKYN